MDNLVILNVALTVFFVYLLLSVIVSVLQEFIAKLFNRRGELLKEALGTLFKSPQWQSAMEGLMQSGFITAIRENNKKFPDNIPARNFALALVELIRDPQKQASADKNIRQMIIDCPVITDDAEKTLLTMIDKAEGDTNAFIKSIEEMYESLMLRTTVWYKANLHKIVFVIGLVVAFVLNVDTIDMVKNLSRNPTLAKASADMVQQTMNSMKLQNGTITITTADRDTSFIVSVGVPGIIKADSSQVAVAGKDSTKPVASDTVIQADTSLQSVAIVIKDINGTLQNTGLQFNWNNFDCRTADGWAVFYKIIGILLTTFALSLGAPFWYETLSSLLALRNAGKKDGK